MPGMKEQIDLVKVTLSDDAYQTPTRTNRTVFAEKLPVHGNEFHSARASGFDVRHVMRIYSFDYEDEKEAVYSGQPYTIYRTYPKDDDRIELYLTTKGSP